MVDLSYEEKTSAADKYKEVLFMGGWILGKAHVQFMLSFYARDTYRRVY